MTYYLFYDDYTHKHFQLAVDSSHNTFQVSSTTHELVPAVSSIDYVSILFDLVDSGPTLFT